MTQQRIIANVIITINIVLINTPVNSDHNIMIMHKIHPAGRLRDARIDHNQCKNRFESKLILAKLMNII